MAELALSIVAHAVLGVALAVGFWALGLGWLRLLPLPGPAFAYPLGLLAATAAAWLVLVSPWLAPISLLLLAPAVAGVRAAAVASAPVAPFAGALGIALGSLLHGPTADVDSRAFGDLLFYAAKLVSAHESVLPFRDLLVEGERSAYVEAGSSFVGAALAFVPGLDPILFQAAVLPAFLVAALGAGFRLLGVRASSRDACLLALLGAAVIAYPTWVTESPPVAFALPLAFAVVALARDPLSLAAIAGAVVVLGLGFALTKGFGVVPLAVATAFAAAAHRRELDARRLAVYAAAPALVALAGLVFFVATSGWLTDVLGLKFLPADALDGLRTQLDRRDTQAVAPAFLVIGEVLLAAVLARARAWPAFAIFAAGVAGNWLVSGHGFDVAVGIGIVAALLFLAERIETLPLVLASGAALALAAAFRDVFGARAGLVLALMLAGGVFAALAPPRAVAVGAVAVAAGVGAGLVAGRSDPGLASSAVTLPRSEYEAWRAVEDVVPRDGLVFTSLTGPAVTGDQGWNYYPGVAGRQVYLAGWSSSELLVDDAERERRLALNAAVLAGEVTPGSVPVSRRYGARYALVRRGERAPNASRVLYANDDFTLYELP